MKLSEISSVIEKNDSYSPAFKIVLVKVVFALQQAMLGRADGNFSMVCGLVPVNQEKETAEAVADFLNKNHPVLRAKAVEEEVWIYRNINEGESFLPQLIESK